MHQDSTQPELVEQMSEDDDLEIALTDKDCTPRPRRGETQADLELRLDAMTRKAFGPPLTVISDAQIDDIVERVSSSVTEAVMRRVTDDVSSQTRETIADALSLAGARLTHKEN